MKRRATPGPITSGATSDDENRIEGHQHLSHIYHSDSSKGGSSSTGSCNSSKKVGIGGDGRGGVVAASTIRGGAASSLRTWAAVIIIWLLILSLCFRVYLPATHTRILGLQRVIDHDIAGLRQRVESERLQRLQAVKQFLEWRDTNQRRAVLEPRNDPLREEAKTAKGVDASTKAVEMQEKGNNKEKMQGSEGAVHEGSGVGRQGNVRAVDPLLRHYDDGSKANQESSVVDDEDNVFVTVCIPTHSRQMLGETVDYLTFSLDLLLTELFGVDAMGSETEKSQSAEDDIFFSSVSSPRATAAKHHLFRVQVYDTTEEDKYEDEWPGTASGGEEPHHTAFDRVWEQYEDSRLASIGALRFYNRHGTIERKKKQSPIPPSHPRTAPIIPHFRDEESHASQAKEEFDAQSRSLPLSSTAQHFEKQENDDIFRQDLGLPTSWARRQTWDLSHILSHCSPPHSSHQRALAYPNHLLQSLQPLPIQIFSESLPRPPPP